MVVYMDIMREVAMLPNLKLQRGLAQVQATLTHMPTGASINGI